LFITAVGGGIAIVFNCFAVADSHGLHPRTMGWHEFDGWLKRQWLSDRATAIKWTNRITAVSILPVVTTSALRFIWDVSLPLSAKITEVFIVVSVCLIVVGSGLSLAATSHPKLGNEQRGLKGWEAWIPNVTLGLYVSMVILVLP
jgi:hypothetical protein